MSSSESMLTWRRVIFASAVLLAAYPPFVLAREEIRARRAAQAEVAPAPAPGTPESLLGLSLEHYRAKRFRESIAAAREALRLRPDYAEAYNNIASAYAELGSWDDAIWSAEQALRLNPALDLARNNLAWARRERDRAAGSR